ncbi:MAG: hypothetical protein CEN90_98 [Parcubacteria group bacterium Licking1014_17]|nr:MAG: hypothetical protein CEN90_98 [Parcubacteria group bacterium Licking1014_17]
MVSWLKRTFVPYKDNKYTPHLLKKRGIISVIVIIVLIEALFLASAFIIYPNTNFLSLILPNVLVDLVNQSRKTVNASTLAVNPLLEKAAQLKAEDMVKKGYFAHVSPEGTDPWYWLKQAGYQYTAAGENLAVNFIESKEVHDAWMNSATHRANIVNGKYMEIGIATAKGIYKNQEAWYVVQFFGRPAKYVREAMPINLSGKKTTMAPETSGQMAVITEILLGAINPSAKNQSDYLGHLLTSPKSIFDGLLEAVLLACGTVMVISLAHPDKNGRKKRKINIWRVSAIMTLTLIVIVLNQFVFSLLKGVIN